MAHAGQIQQRLTTLGGNVTDLRASTDRQINRLKDELLSDNNGQFDAVNARIDGLQELLTNLRDRTATVQTLVTNLNGVVAPFGPRFDTIDRELRSLRQDLTPLETRLNQRIQSLQVLLQTIETHLNQRLDHLRGLLDPLESRLTTITDRFDVIETRLSTNWLTGALDPRFEALRNHSDTQTTTLQGQLTDLDHRFNDTNEHVEAVRQHLTTATASALKQSDLDRHFNHHLEGIDNRHRANLVEMRQISTELVARRPHPRTRPKVNFYCVVM